MLHSRITRFGTIWGAINVSYTPPFGFNTFIMEYNQRVSMLGNTTRAVTRLKEFESQSESEKIGVSRRGRKRKYHSMAEKQRVSSKGVLF